MNGLQYEQSCAKLLLYRGFHKIVVTKSSGDQGVDIIAHKNGKKYAIQCKYYKHPVGNKAVQEAYSGANFYDCDAAIVMTNNTYTRSARELADKLNVILLEDCSPTVTTSAISMLMRVINVFFLIIAIGCFFSTSVYNYPDGNIINYMCMFMIFLASIFGIFAWNHLIPSVMSGMLYFGVFFIIFLPRIMTSNYSFYELALLVPASINILHSLYMTFKRKHTIENL